MTPDVRRTTAPACRATATMTRVDYADAFALALPASGACSIDAITRIVLTSAPAWVDVLMRVRNAVVRPFGLRAGVPERGGSVREDARLAAGDRVGIFFVRERADEEVLLGMDDRHLDFRVSVMRDAARCSVTVVTAVQFNNWLGRAYFIPVRPMHRLIVPAMLRRAARRLAAQAR